MKLIVAHQILIGSATALALLFGVRALVLASRDAPGPNVAIGIGSLVIAVVLGLYFRTLRAKARAEKA